MEFPMLFSIAMDYLSIQAMSVPCERVFSSAKDTDTAKRNRINLVTMEALQMLKYSLKKERLNFMDGWPTSEAVMSGVSKAGNLSSLFVDDHDAVFDTLLNDLNKYNNCKS
jgi:hAT family C-terminal dimerisation region